VDKTQAVRKDRRQVSSRWFPDAAGRLPQDPVRRVALRLARARGQGARMGDEIWSLLFGRRLSIVMNGDLEQAIPRMSAEDFAHARSKLQALAVELDHDQALIERLLGALAEAERRRLTVLDGGRA
jgi:hypothetical protein